MKKIKINKALIVVACIIFVIIGVFIMLFVSFTNNKEDNKLPPNNVVIPSTNTKEGNTPEFNKLNVYKNYDGFLWQRSKGFSSFFFNDVVYVNSSGLLFKNNTKAEGINGKVKYVTNIYGCDGNVFDTIFALTESGELYMYKESESKEAFRFTKYEVKDKIKELFVEMSAVQSTCGGLALYALTENDELKHYYRDYDYTTEKYSDIKYKLYEELNPKLRNINVGEWLSNQNIWLDEIGKGYFNNENEPIKFDGKALLIKDVLQKTIKEKEEYVLYLFTTDNKIYTVTLKNKKDVYSVSKAKLYNKKTVDHIDDVTRSSKAIIWYTDDKYEVIKDIQFTTVKYRKNALY